MKRQFRNDMSDEQKQAISQALKGRRHSEEHKRKIAQSMEKYWAELPTKPDENKTQTERIYGKDN